MSAYGASSSEIVPVSSVPVGQLLQYYNDFLYVIRLGVDAKLYHEGLQKALNALGDMTARTEEEVPEKIRVLAEMASKQLESETILQKALSHLVKTKTLYKLFIQLSETPRDHLIQVMEAWGMQELPPMDPSCEKFDESSFQHRFMNWQQARTPEAKRITRARFILSLLQFHYLTQDLPLDDALLPVVVEALRCVFSKIVLFEMLAYGDGAFTPEQSQKIIEAFHRFSRLEIVFFQAHQIASKDEKYPEATERFETLLSLLAKEDSTVRFLHISADTLTDDQIIKLTKQLAERCYLQEIHIANGHKMTAVGAAALIDLANKQPSLRTLRFSCSSIFSPLSGHVSQFSAAVVNTNNLSSLQLDDCLEQDILFLLSALKTPKADHWIPTLSIYFSLEGRSLGEAFHTKLGDLLKEDPFPAIKKLHWDDRDGYATSPYPIVLLSILAALQWNSVLRNFTFHWEGRRWGEQKAFTLEQLQTTLYHLKRNNTLEDLGCLLHQQVKMLTKTASTKERQQRYPLLQQMQSHLDRNKELNVKNDQFKLTSPGSLSIFAPVHAQPKPASYLTRLLQLSPETDAEAGLRGDREAERKSKANSHQILTDETYARQRRFI
jgi:hypothetical protein